MLEQGDATRIRRYIAEGANPNTVINEEGETPLHVAAMRGLRSSIFPLVAGGAALEVKSKSGNTPLHLAARSANSSTIDSLISIGADVNACSVGEGVTPLHFASAMGHTESIKSLLRKGANVNARALKSLSTPLHLAAEKGNISALRVLVAAGADLYALDEKGAAPIHIAVASGNITAAQFLVSCGCDINLKTNSGLTPLMLAAEEGLASAVKSLLSKGADPNATDEEGLTALHISARGRLGGTIVPLLVASGAQVNARKGSEMLTPLHIAAAHNNTSAIVGLIASAKRTSDLADLELPALDGFTPLHLAAGNGSTDAIVALLEHGASVNAETEHGLKPIHLAALQENQSAITALLHNQGENVDACTTAGFTPLHLAAACGQVRAIETLLQHKAFIEEGVNNTHYQQANKTLEDPGQRIKQVIQATPSTPILPSTFSKIYNLLAHFSPPMLTGCTPLHMAAFCGFPVAIEALLAKGADIEAKSKVQFTPLSIAAAAGELGAVETLVAHDANKESVTKAQYTPLLCASANGHVATFEHLLEAGADRRHFVGQSVDPPLIDVAIEGFTPGIESVLANRICSVDVRDNDGLTALHRAAHGGKVASIEALLAAGADPNAEGLNGVTPLHYAVKGDHVGAVAALVAGGADVTKIWKIPDELIDWPLGDPNPQAQVLIQIGDRTPWDLYCFKHPDQLPTKDHPGRWTAQSLRMYDLLYYETPSNDPQ